MKLRIFIFLSIFLVSINLVYGFGMASTYIENGIMYLAPGEIKEYKVELQNNDPVEQNIKFELESDIATIKNEQEFYVVGGDKIKQNVILVIEVPKNVQIGKEYTVKYSAVPTSDTGSQISLNIKFSKDFKVIVREKELEITGDLVKDNKFNFGKIPVVLILILIFSLAILLIFKKNKALIRRILKKWNWKSF